jgi:hypothetical protein
VAISSIFWHKAYSQSILSRPVSTVLGKL